MTNYTLITGASAGIGKSLAVALAKRKHNLVLVARRLEKLIEIKYELENTYKVKVLAFSCDLSNRQSIHDLLTELNKQTIHLNYLINNAGFGYEGTFKNQSLENIFGMIDLNISALTHLSHYFINQIDSNTSGGILQIASLAAYFPGPYMAEYYATKAYVKSFSRAINFEFNNTTKNIYCSVLYPGPVLTEFQIVAGIESTNLFKGKLIKPMTSDKVAEITADQFLKKKKTIIPGFMNKFSVALSPFIPYHISNHLTAYLHEH